MNQQTRLSKLDILFFPLQENDQACSQLKTFLHFLKTQSKGQEWRFSFVDSEAPLLNGLTIRENIYLDSIPNSLTSTKEFQLKTFLRRKGNVNLMELFNKIQLLDEYPENVDAQTRKLAALIKGMLQDTDYLLLGHPEKYLDRQNRERFIRALEFQASSTGQIILVASEEQEFWSPMMTKIVERNENKQFEIKPVLRKAISEESDRKPNEGNTGHLKFFNFEQEDKKAS